MITEIAEVVIRLAAIVASVGGVAFIVYFIALVWKEHREELAFLEDYRREQAARRAALGPKPARPAATPAPVLAAVPSHALRHPV